jgi:hypothetical protein
MIDLMEGGESGTPAVIKNSSGPIANSYLEITKALEIEIQSWE